MRPTPLLAALALGAAVLAVYLPAAGFDLLEVGDRAILTGEAGGPFAPLAAWTLRAEAVLFAGRAGALHLAGVLFFALAAALFVLVFFSLTGNLALSAASGAAFALHPLRAESVAWVAAQGDTLGLLLAALALGAWLKATRGGGARWKAVSSALLALGILASPALLAFPLLLLALDFWPLGRMPSPGRGSLRRLAAEKAPLFAVSLLLALPAAWRAGAEGNWLSPAAAVSLPFRVLAGTFFPVDLPLAEPGPADAAWPILVLGAAALSGITWGCLRLSARAPWLAAGWCWFLAALLPALLGPGGAATTARSSLLPHLGLALALGGAGSVMLPRLLSPRAAAASLLAVLLALGIVSGIQARGWESDQALFTRIIEVNPDPLGFFQPFTRAVEGLILESRGGPGSRRAGPHPDTQLDRWEASLRHRIRWHEEQAAPPLFLATILYGRGRHDAAEVEYERVLLLKGLPPWAAAAAHAGRGRCLERLNHPGDAEAQYRESLALDPGQARVHLWLALLLNRLGRDREAIGELRTVVRLAPGTAEGAFAEERLRETEKDAPGTGR